jgi:hypothetical protein
LNAKIVYAKYGTSKSKFNAGENIFADYFKNYQIFGNYVGQGVANTLQQADISISYMINPLYNLNISAGITDRSKTVGADVTHTTLLYFALRSSLDNMFFDY